MSTNEGFVKKLLYKLDAEVSPKVRGNKQYVNLILEKLLKVSKPETSEGGCGISDYDGYQEILSENSTSSNIFNVTYKHGGSAYEGLAINKSADFDIIVELGKPFLERNFDLKRDPSRFFTLEWKSYVDNPLYSDCDRYLDASKLRANLFPHLAKRIESISLENATISYKELISALQVDVKFNDGNQISLDLVPQIAFHSWDLCLGLKPVEELPEELKKYVRNLAANGSPGLCLNVALPPFSKPDNADQLFNISFSFLEKTFFTSQVYIRNMVRLVKLVAGKYDWKRKFYFQPYFAKRVAVKYCNELNATKSLWEGFQELLRYISKDLDSGTIDGYFITDQVTCKLSRDKIVGLQREIERILGLNAEDLF